MTLKMCNSERQKPEHDSQLTQRVEMARIPHNDKTITGKYWRELDPDPLKAHVCCGWAFTGNIMPDKLVLRSGWEPGNLFALVDLFPRSFPFNAGGIMGMNRWGAPFTQISSSKGHTAENRLLVVDT